MFMHPEDIYAFEKARHQELIRQFELERHARRARAGNRGQRVRGRRTVALARRWWAACIGLFALTGRPDPAHTMQDAHGAPADDPLPEVAGASPAR